MSRQAGRLGLRKADAMAMTVMVVTVDFELMEERKVNLVITEC
jgi:hypothetical protein